MDVSSLIQEASSVQDCSNQILINLLFRCKTCFLKNIYTFILLGYKGCLYSIISEEWPDGKGVKSTLHYFCSSHQYQSFMEQHQNEPIHLVQKKEKRKRNQMKKNAHRIKVCFFHDVWWRGGFNVKVIAILSVCFRKGVKIKCICHM